MAVVPARAASALEDAVTECDRIGLGDAALVGGPAYCEVAHRLRVEARALVTDCHGDRLFLSHLSRTCSGPIREQPVVNTHGATVSAPNSPAASPSPSATGWRVLRLTARRRSHSTP